MASVLQAIVVEAFWHHFNFHWYRLVVVLRQHCVADCWRRSCRDLLAWRTACHICKVSKACRVSWSFSELAISPACRFEPQASPCVAVHSVADIALVPEVTAIVGISIVGCHSIWKAWSLTTLDSFADL